jgi:tRNA pseudouridine55 synthase
MIQSGFLNLNKRKFITSFSALNEVASLTKPKSKVGHTGTLDPLCTGVLVLVFGKCTKLAQFFVAQNKSYRATIKLGETTDSYDSQGKVTQTRSTEKITENEIQKSLDHFRGSILQKPPMFSALNSNGKRLYELAREGKTVDIAPRKIFINKLEIEGFNLPEFTLRVECSKGTYVRSLAHDIGEVLGCGGHITALERLSVGNFRIEDSIGFESLSSETIHSQIRPIDQAFPQFSSIYLSPDRIKVIPKVSSPEMLNDFSKIITPSMQSKFDPSLLDSHSHNHNNEQQQQTYIPTFEDVMNFDYSENHFFRVYSEENGRFVGFAYSMQSSNRFKFFYCS